MVATGSNVSAGLALRTAINLGLNFTVDATDPTTAGETVTIYAAIVHATVERAHLISLNA